MFFLAFARSTLGSRPGSGKPMAMGCSHKRDGGVMPSCMAIMRESYI
jgi:hypothetical protein